MRYREDQGPNPEFPYAESMHNMLTLSMILGIIFGIGLLWLSIRGRVLWLKVWSIGLIVLSAAYLLADALGWV